MALDFIKAVTHIMSLERESKEVRESVAGMKRLLLVQLQVQEFSLESEFKNPNPSYILRDVICSYCSLCR
jgi:DNA polymerase epsilon subunit 1